MMLSLGWIFLWLVTGERIKGMTTSDCLTKKLLWEYSSRSEEFVLFCDLTELQKSHLYHRSQLSPTQGSENLPCSGHEDLSDVQWYLQPQNGDSLGEITNNFPHITQDKSNLCFLTAGISNAGSYICRPRIWTPQDEACCIKTILEVKPKTNLSCIPNNSVSQQYLLFGSIAKINCPSLNCQSDAQSPEVTWYQNGKLLPKERSNPIVVNEVYETNQGTYVCDYTQSDNTSSWIVRAVVQVRTIVKDTTLKPDILDPIKDVLEVELGKPLTLNCRARFGHQRDFNPVVKWYIKDSDQESEVPTPETIRVKHTIKDEVYERVIHLKEVTQRDLRKKFICFAQNSIGNTTQSIQLKEKKGDKKVFDAFISYAKWSSFENETTSSLSEEYLALNLFPEVLENKYGYNLCLLDRDVAPGGVYAEDIVNIIKKSRRGIFILSPNYVNGPSIFELQAAVNLALDDKTLKLILIKFCSFQEPESLPHLVKKALRVLPTVTWRNLKSVPPNSRFWTQMRYHMPVKNSKGLRWNHLGSISKVFHWK
ncbi:interleukin-18 receptor accessory protein isoform X2 [Vulpes lagopus]|uniref:interleukin-18 receptor accessory protein isoform X2 n=1 Tax=Vulpes lagopus TaxID=494514 RepID=UPI001BC95B6A|nr:interleukin-18 receptor accessory protein isoform X2 [Vulpes lagopus]